MRRSCSCWQALLRRSSGAFQVRWSCDKLTYRKAYFISRTQSWTGLTSFFEFQLSMNVQTSLSTNFCSGGAFLLADFALKFIEHLISINLYRLEVSNAISVCTALSLIWSNLRIQKLNQTLLSPLCFHYFFDSCAYIVRFDTNCL